MIHEYLKSILYPPYQDTEVNNTSVDAKNNSNQQKSPEKDIQLVRTVDRTIHVSPMDRRKEVDYTVRNPTDSTFNFVFLPLPQFERNLEVFDEDGRKLNYYPNRIVENWRESRPREDQLELKQKFEHSEYSLLVQLPRKTPLGPGDLRTIQITYEQSEPIEYHRIWEPSLFRGWYSDWKKKFFRIPTFIADSDRYPGPINDEFVVVVGPSGYSTYGSAAIEGGEPSRNYYENGLDDNTRVVSVRVPPADDEPFEWEMEYDLVPNNNGLMKVLVGFWILASLTGGLSILIELLGGYGDLEPLFLAMSGGIITATLGLIFALEPQWTNRYKIMSIIPLLFHGGAWTVWQII